MLTKISVGIKLRSAFNKLRRMAELSVTPEKKVWPAPLARCSPVAWYRVASAVKSTDRVSSVGAEVATLGVAWVVVEARVVLLLPVPSVVGDVRGEVKAERSGGRWPAIACGNQL